MAEVPLTFDDELLDEKLLASLVQFDEALRVGQVPTNPADALSDDQLAELTTAAHCLLELEELIPRQRSGSAASPPILVSNRVGRFEIDGVLGSGGFAVVYKAHDRVLDRTVAVKVPRPHVLAAPDLRKRFVREAQAAAQLDHPNIVPIHEAGADGELPYIAYAYCDGPTLAAWQKNRGEPLAPEWAARLMILLAEAVQYSHERGILHRDIKPANVLLFPQSTPADPAFPFVPRLSDLGLAKLIESNLEETANDLVLGTPLYMSPEQAEGRHADIGTRSDIYSLGAVLYFLLTGRPPFLAAGLIDTLRQVVEAEPIAPTILNPAVDQDLNVICLKCLEKSPSRRYATAQDLADDLRRFLSREPIHARATTTRERCWRWCRRKPALAGLLTGVACLMLSLFASLLWQRYSASAFQQQITQRNDQLTNTVAKLNDSLQATQRQKQIAEANEERVIQLLYAADLRLVATAIRKSNLREAGQLLMRHPESEREFAWRYLRNQVSPPSRLIANTDQAIWHMTHSPDGRLLAAAGSRSRVQIFDVDSDYRLVRTLETNQQEINSFAFSSDSRILATAGDDGRVGLWNVEMGENIRWLEVIPGNPVYGVTFLGDDKQLVACGRSTDPSIWDVATGARVKSWAPPHTGRIESLAVSPDGQLLATAGADHVAVLFRLGVEEPLHRLIGHTGSISAVQFTSDSKFVITAGRDGKVRMIDVATSLLQMQHMQRPDGISAMALSRSGRLACGDRGGVITLLDTTPPPDDSQPAPEWPIQNMWTAADGRIGGLAFAPQGDAILSGDAEGRIRYWAKPTATREPQRLILPTGTASEAIYQRMCVGEDPDTLYRAGSTGLEVWDIRNNQQTATLAKGTHVTACACRCDAGSILVGDNRGRVGSIRMDNRSQIEWLELEELAGQSIIRVDSYDEGRTILAQSQSNEIAIIEAANSKVRARLSNRSAMAPSPDGRWLVTGRHGSDDVVILSTDTLQVIAQRPAHNSTIVHIEFSRDGSLLLSASQDRTVVLWDTRTWQPKHKLFGHDQGIGAAAFSPDGKTIATGDLGGTIKLWRAA